MNNLLTRERTQLPTSRDEVPQKEADRLDATFAALADPTRWAIELLEENTNEEH